MANPGGFAAASGGFGLDWAQGEQFLQGGGVFLQGRAQPVRIKKSLQHHFQERFELDVGHRKARQGPVGGVTQFEAGPGQGREHGVDVEVVACGGAGLAGGQPQVLLGVAEVELDLEAVDVDAVNPFRRHLRVAGEEGRGPGLRRGIIIFVQDEDHPQQFPEGLADQLGVVQPQALVRQLDQGQFADAAAVEAAGILARAARPAGGRPGRPVGGPVQGTHRAALRRSLLTRTTSRAASPVTMGSQA